MPCRIFTKGKTMDHKLCNYLFTVINLHHKTTLVVIMCQKIYPCTTFAMDWTFNIGLPRTATCWLLQNVTMRIRLLGSSGYTHWYTLWSVQRQDFLNAPYRLPFWIRLVMRSLQFSSIKSWTKNIYKNFSLLRKTKVILVTILLSTIKY